MAEDKSVIPAAQWTPVNRIFFRLAFPFFVLYILPFPLTAFWFLESWNGWIARNYRAFWKPVVTFSGNHFFGVSDPGVYKSAGSGDSMYAYLWIFTILAIAALVGGLWTVLDRKRKSYNTAFYWLNVLIRLFLIYMLLSYGFAKVLHMQMMTPTLAKLVLPFGNQSPMGLAWSYVGFSKAYSQFCGWAEVIGGLLLVSRRTVTLGSLLNIVVLGNVVMMNFCYDIPVKLPSFMLLTMSVFLLIPDIRRLSNAFLLQRDTRKITFPGYLPAGKAGALIHAGKWLLVAGLVYHNIDIRLDARKIIGDQRPKPALYGIYNVTHIVRNGDSIPLLVTDQVNWRQLIIDHKDRAVIRQLNDSSDKYSFKVDSGRHTIVARLQDGDTTTSYFRYSKDRDTLFLSGRLRSDSIYMRLQRVDPGGFRLLSRKFKWISDYPYNY